MKKKDLEERFKGIEGEYPQHKVNHTQMFNLQYDTSKLYMEIINEFNEKTEVYNRRLLWFTIVIAILTFVMTISASISLWSQFKMSNLGQSTISILKNIGDKR